MRLGASVALLESSGSDRGRRTKLGCPCRAAASAGLRFPPEAITLAVRGAALVLFEEKH